MTLNTIGVDEARVATVSLARNASCPFCLPPKQDLWVMVDLAGALLVDKCPLVLGHALAIPAHHVPSTLDLDRSHARSFDWFLSKALDRLSRRLGRQILALEHGRSPICSTGGGACHAHVHLIPTDLAAADVEVTGLVRAVQEPGDSDFLAARDSVEQATHFYRPIRPVRHLVRSVVTSVADEYGLHGWLPLAATVSARARIVRQTLGALDDLRLSEIVDAA